MAIWSSFLLYFELILFSLYIVHSLGIQVIMNKENSFESKNDDELLFPLEWEVLGPFPAGSRELGSDPLSAYGGFEILEYSEKVKFPSELADGGYVSWMKVFTNADGSVGPVQYNNVRWGFNQEVFGWSSLQHSTYFRGTFFVKEEGDFLVSFSNVLSFKIDDTAYVGNVYGYTRASDTLIHLSAGQHQIYVATLLDVRVFGGAVPPNLNFYGKIHRLVSQGIKLYHQDSLIPEFIEDKMISPFGALTFMNTLPLSDKLEENWIQIMECVCKTDQDQILKIHNPLMYSVRMAPGQVVALPVEFEDMEVGPNTTALYFEVKAIRLDSLVEFIFSTENIPLIRRQWGGLYKFTYQGYDGSVQYAMAKPPKSSFQLKKYPVILALHGAGVNADLPFWTEAYHQQELAWVLYPTGRSQWGFDWHGPSLSNVQSSLETLKTMPGVPDELKDGIIPDISKLIYSGHSNGGQGAWWFLSHFPDSAVAAMPAAGYIKIQFYVPYYMRIGDAFADPMLRGILESSISENDIDLYSSNMVGIPLLARTGDRDDNVPPFHTRRLVRLVHEWEKNTDTFRLSEVKGQGHWFDGVMNDDLMQGFLNGVVGNISNDEEVSLPAFPEEFTLTTLNPASTGSRGSIRILQLGVPFRLGQVKVRKSKTKWILKTSNIRRFQFLDDIRKNDIESFEIDGTEFLHPPQPGPSYLKESDANGWTISQDLQWLSVERHPSTYGPISRVLDHPFIIVIPSARTPMSPTFERIARQFALSWYIYGRGVTQIMSDDQVFDGDAARYNMIVLGGPDENRWTKRRYREGKTEMVTFPDDGGFEIGGRKFTESGTGILFLAPNPTRTRLSVFIAGIDEPGFLRAAWSLPFRTGLMIPDYLIVGREYGDPSTGWTANLESTKIATKGAGGILAAGYWNNTWEYDHRCGYLK